MIGRATGLVQHRVSEPEGLQIQTIDEGVNHADRILSGDVFIQRFGEEDHLVAVAAFDVVHGDPLARQVERMRLLWHREALITQSLAGADQGCTALMILYRES